MPDIDYFSDALKRPLHVYLEDEIEEDMVSELHLS